MIRKETIQTQGLVRVTFGLSPALWAERINVVGDFNDWDTRATPMSQSHSDPAWRVAVDLQAGRRYRFRYLVDGKEWLNDWHADDHEEHPCGACDSVIDLTECTASSPS
jgi:1,4-alpha-glucan branching enzyme